MVLLILATSLVLARHVVWVVTSLDHYTSIVGAIWIAGVVPFFLVWAGGVLLLLNKKYGLSLILSGSLLSFSGATWSYIPYLPTLGDDPAARIALLVVGNVAVLATLVWSERGKRSEQASVKEYAG